MPCVSSSTVLHHHGNVILVVGRGADDELPRAACHRGQGFDAVHDEVEDDLLELHEHG